MSSCLLPVSLRAKLIASVVLFVVAMLIVAGVSYSDLETMRGKLRVLQGVNELNERILEARRYEKNFLLYHLRADLSEADAFLSEARAKLAALEHETGGLKVASSLSELSAAAKAYADRLHEVGSLSALGQPLPEGLLVDLREQGKAMLDSTLEIVVFEQARVEELLGTLRLQLVASVGAALILWPLAVFVMFRNYLGILGLVCQATDRVSQGRFEHMDVPAGGSEIAEVIEAFNRMTGELELRQEQLLQSRKLASIGTLAAGIAHQLNNPLNNISTSCQIAQEELGSGDRELLARMLRNVELEAMRARDIVKGLLEFSRSREFALKLTRLSPVVERVVALASSQVPPSVRIVREVPEDLSLEFDAQRMQEVLLNLILNAVEAIGGRPGTITLAAGEDAEAGEAVISVADDGPGIPRDIQGQVFDPFFSTKTGAGPSGTGLGLAIVYGIVQKHRGRIEVESEPGQGTRFVIRLPMPESRDA